MGQDSENGHGDALMVQLVGRVEEKGGEHLVELFILVSETIKCGVSGQPACGADPVGFHDQVYKVSLNFFKINPSRILSL